MRVATVDGLVTLFYDGSKELYNDELNQEWWHARNHPRKSAKNWESWPLSDECKRYWKNRQSWQQIIVMEGVTEIPEKTFTRCKNIKRVIFANTVVRIGRYAFLSCKNLVLVKWSLNLEYIGRCSFQYCNLSSVSIPPRCREIAYAAFYCNKNLSILNIPQDTELGSTIIQYTALAKASPFGETHIGLYNEVYSADMNLWLKNMNNCDAYALHRACLSFQPMKEVLYPIILQKGLKAFQEQNSAGITPSRYLQENPYTDLTEKEIIHDYLMKMMGEIE